MLDLGYYVEIDVWFIDEKLYLGHDYPQYETNLSFTFYKGNDLITSSNNFQGLKAGDRWCLCVLRWLEAYNNGVAPLLDLDATYKFIQTI